MAEIFERNHSYYGYRRMRAAMSRQRLRLRLSEKMVQRLMKQEGPVVAKPKRRRYGSYLGEIRLAPEIPGCSKRPVVHFDRPWEATETLFDLSG